MTDVKKMEKQWKATMNPGWEDYSDGNKLTFALGMKLLSSQTPRWIQYPQAHTNCSWHSERLPHILAVWQKAHMCPGTCRLGLRMLKFLSIPHRGLGVQPFPTCGTFSSYCNDVSYYYYMNFSVINRSAGQVLSEHQEVAMSSLGFFGFSVRCWDTGSHVIKLGWNRLKLIFDF